MNSYSGATSISAGILNLTGTESASAITVSGGEFNEAGLISGGSITVSGGAFNESSPGVISSTVMFTQTGGTIDLQDANTTTGNITVNAGTFTVDSTGGTTANVLKSNGNSVFMGGGTMNFLLSSNSTANTENIYQTEFTAASSSVIEITQNGNSGASLINLGNTTAWTRNAGSIVDFGTVPAGELENTAAKADAINGILTNSTTGVAFATTGGGAAWATINTSTGVIGSLTSFAGSYGSTANISVGTSDTSSTGANTLTFNGAGDTVNFTGATTTITTGGILVTPSATGASSITGGAIQGGTGKELVVINNEPSASGAFTISSVIQDNTTASALTIGGTGTTILTNANTFSGVTNITTSGNLQLGNANALQDSTLVFNPTTTSAGLTFSSGIGTFTVAGLTGSTNAANILTLKDVGGTAVNLQVGNNNASSSFNSGISGGTLTKIGTGLLTLNSGNNITSAVVVNGGSLLSSNTVDLQNVPSLTINNGGVVYYVRGSVAIASGAATDTVTINSGGILSSDYYSGAPGSADTAIGAVTLNGGTIATRNQLTTGDLYYDRGTFGFGNYTGVVAGTAVVTAGGGTNPTSTISAVNVAIRETGGTIFNVMAGSGAGGSLAGPGGIDLLFSGTILSRSNSANTTLIKQGNGVMALTGSNAFATPVQISAGTLEINTIANGGVQTTGVGSSGGTSITVTSATGLAAGEAVGAVGAGSNISAGSTIAAGYSSGSTTVPITSPDSAGTLPGAVNTTLNFGVANSLGISTNAASNLIINGGTLQYVGTTAGSTDRLFQIGASADTAATTATIDSSSPTADTLTFTNTGAITYGLTNKADTLTFQGSNTGANTFDPTIGNNGTGAVSVAKTGAGEWVLGSTSGYTGSTTVTGGTLIVSGALSGTPTVSVNAGTLQLSKTGLYTSPISTAATLSLGLTAAATFAMSNDGTNMSLSAQSSQTFASLTLNQASSIDLGSNTTGDGNALVISGGAGGVTLTNFTSLAVLDWSGTGFAPGATTDPGTTLTQDDLLFGSSSNVLTAFGDSLGVPDSRISFSNDAGTFIGYGEFVDVTGGTYNNDIELVAAIPEPGAWAMLISGAGMFVLLRRRRQA
jgi:fibronectin-binding autotransporter adhesin